jgi:AraC family transcriptional regulator
MTTLAYGRTFGEVFAAPAATVTATLSVHPADADTPPHAHANDYVCLVLAGRFRESSARGDFDWRPGDAVIHRGEERHQDSFGPAGARCLNLHLTGGLAAEPGGRRLDPGTRSLAEALAAEVALGRDAGLEVEALSAELLGSLLADGEAPRDDGQWIGGVIEAIDQAPERAWRLDELAAVAGRHPTHLARAFRRRTGLSLGAWRRRRRVTELCLRLRGEDTPLADLAADLGYADQAHMSREFRALAAAAPGAWRRAARAAAA